MRRMWEHAVAGTAGLLSRPVLLTCSAPGCEELVRARYCTKHGPKHEERAHVSSHPGARGEGGSNLWGLFRRNRRAATKRRKGTPLK